MSEIFKLTATPRNVLGKKVKQYRRRGEIPANVYGPDFAPVSIFVKEPELRHVLARAGGTHLIELDVDGTLVTTLAREVQRHPLQGSLLHVDFYRVAMDRPIHTEIPLTVVGASPAVARREAIVLQAMTSVVIEVLPADLPDHIEVSISDLTAVGDHVLVSDLQVPPAVKVLTPPDELVLKLDYAEAVAPEEEAAEAVSAEVEVITAKKPEAEGETEE